MRGLLALSLIMTVVPPPAFAADDEDKRLASRLIDLMSKVAASPESVPRISVKGGEVEVARHRLRITPVSERALQANGRFISAARFDIEVDGEKQANLTAGSVGVGDSPDDATNTAVQEWYLAFGAALLRGIADTRPDLTEGGFRVYKGTLGTRGQVPKDAVAGDVMTPHNVLKAISGALPRADGKLHAVQVMVVVAPDNGISGECAIDGQISPVALASVRGLSWPRAPAQYMYKQAYVLK